MKKLLVPRPCKKISNQKGSIKHIQVIIMPKQPKLTMLDP
jgi:hypothetical protein